MPYNPPWLRDELILALDLYFRLGPSRQAPTVPEAVELSEVLRSLKLHTNVPDMAKFRNPNGVVMKLANLQHFDTSHPGKGLSQGSKADERIWEEFHADRDGLANAADRIRRHAGTGRGADIAPDGEETVAAEGRVVLRTHRYHERSRGLRRDKITRALEDHGRLTCEVCEFDFREAYGEIGDGYIQCHHLVPLSELGTGSNTRLRDLALVCANCHVMLHAGGATRSVEGLRGLLRSPPRDPSRARTIS